MGLAEKVPRTRLENGIKLLGGTSFTCIDKFHVAYFSFYSFIRVIHNFGLRILNA